VQPGQDGTLPAMDRGGFGIQSMVWGGPMQTGEASVREKQDQRERRDLSKAMKASGHGEASVVTDKEDNKVDVWRDQPRARKRDMFKRLFKDDAQQKPPAQMTDN